ncbi:hypothetical protein GGF42_001780 [Coemansia sp. RSA 2424]|nr:hypothetical protein GGF42_001780 [Coemansia sp. RSA 2424]
MSQSQIRRISAAANNHEKLLKPLLWICRNFRAVAYPLYCRRLGLGLYGASDDELEDESQQSYALAFGYPIHHLVKELSIDLQEASIYTGAALKILSRAPDDGCVFPVVQVLTVLIVADEGHDKNAYTDISWQVVGANIDAFVDRIAAMVPTLKEIRVRYDNIQSLSKVNRLYIDCVVPELLRLAKRIEYRDCGEAAVLPTFDVGGICDLTHVKCNYAGDSSRFFQLARQSAQTLQTLDLYIERNIQTARLIQNDDGSYVTYPQLVSLRLCLPWWMFSKGEIRPVFSSDVVPFPSLRRIYSVLFYPFSDDTLFRGNAATLERLQINLGAPTVAMLRRYSVFTPTSHPKLWHVKIEFDDCLIPDAFDTAEEGVAFSLSIGPGASVRELAGDRYTYVPAIASFYLGDHASIQMLVLPWAELSLWDVIALIKSLPLLSELHCRPPHLGEIPAGVPQDDLPAYVCTHYAPVGKQFRYWHLNALESSKLTESATCVLLLALVCPSFDYPAIFCSGSWAFKLAMEEAIASDMFKEHAPRLRRLAICECIGMYY